MAPLYRNDRDREIFVSGKEVEDRYAADPAWNLVAEKPAPEVPEGDPSDTWTVAQLTAWAGQNGVEVPAGPKPAVVEAVLSATAERKSAADTADKN